MSNEIVKSTAHQVQPFNFFDSEQFAVMQRVCTMFANSELVPDMYKITANNPKEKAIANCMIAVEISQRIGASTLMVMQNLNIIYGRPTFAAKFLAATVNACGRFNSLKYRFTKLGKSLKGIEYVVYEWDNNAKKKLPKLKKFEEDIEDVECIAYTSEKGSDEILESVPVTIEMAIKESWYNKENSKWKTMPRLMLQYRTVSFWTNAYAPELSMGMKTTEELEDYIEYEEMPAKVNNEIKANANKQEMTMEDTKPQAPEEKSNGTTVEEKKMEGVEVNPI